MFRRIAAVPLVVLATALAACGAQDDAESAISAQAAKASVEKSAHIKLAPQQVPADARDQGLKTAYSNTSTAIKDGQAVVLLLLEDADVADRVRDYMKGSVPEPSRLIVKDNVMVVYAPVGGKDRAAQVERAVKAL